MKRIFWIALFSVSLFGQDYLATSSAQPAGIPPVSFSISVAARNTPAVPMRAWKLSLVPLVASQALDAGSSWGHMEKNPLLASSNGRFEGRAAGIKFGTVGVAIAAEYFLLKRHPKIAKFIIQANCGSAAVTTGLAVHNFAALH